MHPMHPQPGRSVTTDPDSISLFKDVFLAHGVLGFRDEIAFKRIEKVTELQKLRIVPLIFGLLPLKAFKLGRIKQPVKQAIADHLRNVGVLPDDTLLSVLKNVADQYSATDTLSPRGFSKMGIANIRALQASYKKLKSRQQGRCSACGARLLDECDETLDHILPYRLVGDIPDGANWQILCTPCNQGKSEYITSLQSREAHGWIYGRGTDHLHKIGRAHV